MLLHLTYSVLKAELIPAVPVAKDVSLQMTLIRNFSRVWKAFYVSPSCIVPKEFLIKWDGREKAQSESIEFLRQSQEALPRQVETASAVDSTADSSTMSS